MLVITVFALLFVVCGVASILIAKYGDWDWDWLGVLNGAIAIIAAFVLACMGCDLINKDKEFQLYINQYENVKLLVDNYEPNDYGNKTALLEEVVKINNRIAKHKAYVGNKWTGAWYSEDIANLEPIVFKPTKPFTNGTE